MGEDFDYDKLADLIAKQMKGTQEQGIGGEVKHLSDVKLEELEKRMTARLDALEAENKELRAANAELYAAATKQQNAQQSAQQTAESQSQVHAAQAVPQTQQQTAEQAAAAKSYEDMYKQAVSQMGYPTKQADGM